MKFLIELIKGVFVGIANIIPGVSGGTMAVSFGIYDKILSSISNLFKDFKKSFKTLFPIALGMAIGIICFTFIIPYLLKNYPFITSMAFTGLILGGLPAIINSLKEGWKNDKNTSLAFNVILFVLLAAISIILPFLKGDAESGVLLTANLVTIVKIFFMGIIASATMIIPGVSGSLVLMILGYYFGILTAIKEFLTALKDFNWSEMFNQALILAPFAIGCILGIFFISKLIEWLLKKYCSATFSGILGLIISSPISIFYKVNQEYSMKKTSIIEIIIGVIIFILCILLTKFIANLETDKEKTIKDAS